MKIFFLVIVVGLNSIAGRAQGLGNGSAKSSAPIDITGYWVSYVTEDWRFRMVTPSKNDRVGVPMSEVAIRVANAWNPRTDGVAGDECKAFGAAAIMRMPSRFHITWQDDDTLRVESDAGMQTRLFRFKSSPSPPGARTLQGNSVAEWQKPASLKVSTTNLRAGYLRTNGVPYSENAVVTEYFDLAPFPGGSMILMDTVIVEDPLYLRQPFVVSSQFKQEANGSKWDPTPCTVK